MKTTLDEPKEIATGFNQKPLAIVGIGSSAGGLESIEALFSKMPVGSNLTFIVLQHLPADFKSTLDNILTRFTEIPSVKLSRSLQLQPNTIYITPPDKKVIVEGQNIVLIDWSQQELESKKPIDTLFSSLAKVWKAKAAGIILSGAGSDGAKGLEAIHEAGGCVMVETSESAQFDGMPNSALALNDTDISLNPYAMPDALLEHYRQNKKQAGKGNDSTDTAEQNGYNSIYNCLKKRFRLDFSQYRQTTIERRLENRMSGLNIDNLEAYCDILLQNDIEAETLYQSFLIGVTEFFRDPEAFSELENSVIPQLLKNKSLDEEVRCWIAGCATGEEAYSLAILLDEAYQKLDAAPNFKIFATDIHKPSIVTASQGIFTEACMGNLSTKRRNRYFLREGSNYKVTPELRSNVVFAEHNLIKDPPFTRMDLVSCRNVLIYFKPNLQKKIISIFHFSLKKQGVLLLGPSEHLGNLEEHFVHIDNRWNIFQRHPESTLSPSIQMHESPPKIIPKIGSNNNHVFPDAQHTRSDIKLSRSMERLLDLHIPQSILVDEHHQLIQSFGDCSSFLANQGGRATLNILELIDSKLRAPLSSALHRTLAKKERSTFENIRFKDRTLKIVTDPLVRNKNESLYISIHFEYDQQNLSVFTSDDIIENSFDDINSKDVVLTLREELNNTQDHLQATIEEFEASNEELQATNEELLTANEELQSTNEELHSVNEELFTVNSEYEQKNKELVALNSDINNLLQSTEIGTVFLDVQLRIRKFTPLTAESLNLIAGDVGRPIAHISHNFIDYPHFSQDIEDVLHTSNPIEKEIRSKNDKIFLFRILPYQESNNKTHGIVLTFIDITALKQAEASVSEHQSRLNMAEEMANLGTWNWNIEQDAIHFGERFAQVSGLPFNQSVSAKDFFELLSEYGESGALNDLRTQISAQDTIKHDWTINCPNGSNRHLRGYGVVSRDASKAPISYRGVITDETDIRKQQETVLQQKKDLETLLYVISHDLREPLRAIRNFSQFLSNDLLSSDTSKNIDYLDRINNASGRMEALLNEVLTLSRVQRMGEPLEEIPGNELVEQALRSLENRIEQTNAKITVANDLPQLRVNRTWAKQAVFNLIANALKFVTAGEAPDILITSYVAPTSSNRHVGIVVQDHGPGIPLESAERIFKLFQRAVGREIEGTGAGLAIVKEVAEKHGGEVFYEARNGGGSKFTITFLK